MLLPLKKEWHKDRKIFSNTAKARWRDTDHCASLWALRVKLSTRMSTRIRHRFWEVGVGNSVMTIGSLCIKMAHIFYMRSESQSLTSSSQFLTLLNQYQKKRLNGTCLWWQKPSQRGGVGQRAHATKPWPTELTQFVAVQIKPSSW